MHLTNASHQSAQAKLSAFWLFVLLNYIYCDIMTHMDSEAMKAILSGTAGNLQITQGFLLGASVYMEIPIAMVLLCRVLPTQAARWACIIAGMIMTAGQVASLFIGTEVANYYRFYSTIEIAGTMFIVWYAWTRLKGVPASIPATA